MLTLEQAKKLQPGDTIYQTNAFNHKQQRRRWRVTGKVKTWKRDPARIHVPIKYGLYLKHALSRYHFDRDGICRFMSLESDQTSERSKFEKSVDINKNDDLPKALFADWLDENGEPELAAELRSTCFCESNKEN